jgi:hypothetical protein
MARAFGKQVSWPPYMEPNVLVDVLQMDIRTCGMLENAALAQPERPPGSAGEVVEA